MFNKKIIFSLIFFVFLFGSFFGIKFQNHFINESYKVEADQLSFDDQTATITAIKKVMPAVVNIVVYDEEDKIIINIDSGEKTIKKEKVEKGSGTGFLISADGLILTNKHVVSSGEEKTSEYRIILSSGKLYYAQLIDKDPINDLAILKIFDKDLPYVDLGDSDNLEIGSTVIAIGNVLGKYQNSVTKGIVSGLGRSLVASDKSGNSEALDNVIQTDAEINFGNSGGPLIDLSGSVIGINVAVDQSGSSIGFAIPINDARPVIRSIREEGIIKRPKLGVRYVMLTPEIAYANEINRNSGALIIEGENGELAVTPDSPADKAGIVAGDIIFEINAIKIENQNTLLSVIQRYRSGDKIGMKIQRGDKVIIRVVELGQF